MFNTVAVPDPDAPLLPHQRVAAVTSLREYLQSEYPLKLPLKLVTYRVALGTRPPADPRVIYPIGSSGRNPGRRSTGVPSDSTATVAIRLAEGVEVLIPEVVKIPAADVTTLLDSLPSLPRVATLLCLVGSRATTEDGATLRVRRSYREAASELGISHSAVSRAVDAALYSLCSLLYASRWELPYRPDTHPVGAVVDGSETDPHAS